MVAEIKRESVQPGSPGVIWLIITGVTSNSLVVITNRPPLISKQLYDNDCYCHHHFIVIFIVTIIASALNAESALQVRSSKCNFKTTSNARVVQLPRSKLHTHSFVLTLATCQWQVYRLLAGVQRKRVPSG